MKLVTLRLSNFQSFGPAPSAVDLEDITYVLGPNGAGKTAVLEALSRLFSAVPAQRKVQSADFHLPLAGRDEEDPALWIEAEFEIAEAASTNTHPAVPPFFSHMAIEEAGGTPRVRVRLSAVLEPDGNVEEKIEYVLEVDADGEPLRTSTMSRSDRANVEVHYLPARRDPTDQISYTTTALLGRVLRAADWTSERAALATLSDTMTTTMAANGALVSVGDGLSEVWNELHRGGFFTDPSVAFGSSDFESILRQLTLRFSPTPTTEPLPFQRLSDGQQSLLYISLALTWRAICRSVLAGIEPSLHPDRLRPPVHTILAIEEPENSLSPAYLGRIIKAIRAACDEGDTQAIVATHSPSMLRRTDPGSIRFLRLDAARSTTVRTITMPIGDVDAAKYVREAVLAYPELYFARLVVLGEGDSEQIVLPRVLAACGIVEDDASVAVVPLGGRHVNHFWRLLNSLDIPHVTLLDLDVARHGGGWGRVRNALKQVNKVRPGTFDATKIEALPKWDAAVPFPTVEDPTYTPGKSPMAALEREGVFFSTPLDLDLMMLAAYPQAYGASRSTVTAGQEEAVLGPARKNVDRLPPDLLELFATYAKKFQRSSKPASHLTALADLTDAEVLATLPAVLSRMVERIKTDLSVVPE